MNWPEAIAWTLVGLGLLAGAFIFASRPAFWIEFGARLVKQFGPMVWAYLTKRMDPSTEARYRACVRSGGKWNHRTKKCE
jgi:hypothetical protein